MLPSPKQSSDIPSPHLTRALLELRHHRQRVRPPHPETPRGHCVSCFGHRPPAGIAWSRHSPRPWCCCLFSLACPKPPSVPRAKNRKTWHRRALRLRPPAASTRAARLHPPEGGGEGRSLSALRAAGSRVWKLSWFSRLPQVAAFWVCSPVGSRSARVRSPGRSLGWLRQGGPCSPPAVLLHHGPCVRLSCGSSAGQLLRLQSPDGAGLLASFLFS